jgi:DNA-binding LacI/PurR family transcriptional regulator
MMSKPQVKNITIKDVAALANVSVATVSRVMNGAETVSDTTRQHVLEVMAAHNYTPNAVARSLITKKSMMLGCVLPDITSPFFSSLFLAAEVRAIELGYSLLLTNTMNSSELESNSLHTLFEKQVDGIFLVGGRINEALPPQKQVDEVIRLNNDIPVVLINGDLPGAHCHVVRANEMGGIGKLVNYLTNLGHRRIALVGGLRDNTSTEIKVEAFQDALRKKGIEPQPHLIIPGGWSVQEGSLLMQKILGLEMLPTAVIGINDLVAIGLMQAAFTHGLRIPTDMSIAGFDDTFLAEAFSPRLTSVSQNYQELGKAAMDVMAALLAGQENVPQETVVETHLSIRDSCQAIHA